MRRIVIAAVAMLAAFGGVLGAPAVQASPASPAGPLIVDVTDVSCLSPHFCMAVGVQAANSRARYVPIAMIWNGARWRKTVIPIPKGWTSQTLGGDSCTSAVYCVAVGGGFNGVRSVPVADTWNGKTWTARALPYLAMPRKSISEVAVSGISCAAPRHCVASMFTNPLPTSGQVFIDSLSGTKWTVHALTPPKGTQWGAFTGVSCVSLTRCVMSGAQFPRTGEAALLATWNGKAVEMMKTKATFPAAFEGVSCASAKSCVAVGTWFTGAGDLGYYGVWNGSIWKGARVLPQNPKAMPVMSPLAVSCPATAECMAVGYYRVPVKGNYPNRPLAEFYNRGSWERLSVPVPAGAEDTDLSGVSCLSPSWCVAVGEYLKNIGAASYTSVAVTAFWNGKSWKLVSAA